MHFREKQTLFPAGMIYFCVVEKVCMIESFDYGWGLSFIGGFACQWGGGFHRIGAGMAAGGGPRSAVC